MHVEILAYTGARTSRDGRKTVAETQNLHPTEERERHLLVRDVTVPRMCLIDPEVYLGLSFFYWTCSSSLLRMPEKVCFSPWVFLHFEGRKVSFVSVPFTRVDPGVSNGVVPLFLFGPESRMVTTNVS